MEIEPDREKERGPKKESSSSGIGTRGPCFLKGSFLKMEGKTLGPREERTMHHEKSVPMGRMPPEEEGGKPDKHWQKGPPAERMCDLGPREGIMGPELKSPGKREKKRSIGGGTHGTEKKAVRSQPNCEEGGSGKREQTKEREDLLDDLGSVRM